MPSLQSLEVEEARLRERHEENPTGRIFAPLADVLRKIGRVDEALELCRDGLSRHPAYSSAYVILGKIHLERGEDAPALDAFEKVLELDNENLLALRQVAKLRESRGELEQAEHLWTRVAALEPDPEAVEERLEALRRRIQRDGETAAEGDEEPDAIQAAEPVTEPVEEEGEDLSEPPVAAQEPEPEAEDESDFEPEPRSASRAAASSAEIATITLAQIYREQGFLHKALEVYEQVKARNPQFEGIDERISELRDEIEQSQTVAAPAEGALEELEVTRDRGSAATEDDATPLREGPITRAVHDRSERERFDGFRRWLDGIADDSEAGSE